jgi:type IV secretory pathway VirB4 component
VLIATLILFVQKYQPITFIFDLGGGFEFPVRLFRGSHVKIGVGKLPFTINIFSLAPTKENLQFIASVVRVLIEARGYRMSDSDLQKLYEAVESVYELDRDQRRLLSLATMLPKHLRDHLAAWVEGGQYGEWFDNVEDTVTFSRFQSFDLEGMERYPELLEAVLYVLLHRINATVVEPELFSTLKVGVMDELWRFLKHPVIRAYVIEALKTWRKKNACMILATQSTEDLVESQMVRHVVESCPTKLFLANPYLDANTYSNVFGLTETEIERVKALIPKRQFLLKRPHLAKVLNLNLDPKSYWMTTTNPYESARRREMVDTLGLERALGALANEE